MPETAPTKRIPGPQCSVGLILVYGPDDVRVDLADKLGKPWIQGTDIAAELRARGFRITGTTLSRHRRGDCVKCPAGGTAGTVANAAASFVVKATARG